MANNGNGASLIKCATYPLSRGLDLQALANYLETEMSQGYALSSVVAIPTVDSAPILLFIFVRFPDDFDTVGEEDKQPDLLPVAGEHLPFDSPNPADGEDLDLIPENAPPVVVTDDAGSTTNES